MGALKLFVTSKLYLPAILLIVVGFFGVAQADSIYVSIEGQNQGLISAGASPGVQGHEDEITAFGFGHSIVVPRDAQTGQRTSARIHQPLRIYKAFDRTSPLLYQALVQNEDLTTVEIRFFRPDQSAQMVNYFTIKLENAALTDITTAAGTDGTSPREVASFTYRKIVWTYVDGGIEYEDTWREPTP